MAEQLIPIATFARPIEAELAKSKLEAGGVRSFVEHGTIARLNPVFLGSGGETKLLVREVDRARSLAILEEDPTQARAALREVFADMDRDGCPRCGSAEISAGYSTLTFVIALLLVGLFLRVPTLLLVLLVPLLFFRRRRFRCLDCAHRWWER